MITDAGARTILDRLASAGHAAYVTGGAARDLLLGRTPKDHDIATSATVDEIAALFPRAIDLAKKYGVLIVPEGGRNYDVATFRKDGPYSDGRRPDTVSHGTLEDDAARRDFTMNALYIDRDGNVLDPTDGMPDIRERLLRFVGEPDRRIAEDKLRMLRAVRFRTVLDFQYHPDTYHAIRARHAEIASVSAERIRDELVAMLLSPRRGEALPNLVDAELLEHVLPEIEALRAIPQAPRFHGTGTVYEHTVRALASLPPDATLVLCLATMFHDCGKAPTFANGDDRIRFSEHTHVGDEVAREALRRLVFPNVVINDVAWLVRSHLALVQYDAMKLATRRKWFADPRFPLLLALAEADGNGYPDPADPGLAPIIADYHAYLEKFPVPPAPLVSGHDIVERGQSGTRVGELKRLVREAQLTEDVQSREEALALLDAHIAAALPPNA